MAGVIVLCLALAGGALSQDIPRGPIRSPYGPSPQHQATSGDRRSDNLFLAEQNNLVDPFFGRGGGHGGGYPGFHGGGYPGYPGSYNINPQQHGDGSWNFFALPIPIENQTIPDDFPRDQVAQAQLWGPIFEKGGWVYGPAGKILVPRAPPYSPPRYVTPPALSRRHTTLLHGRADTNAVGSVDVDPKTGSPLTAVNDETKTESKVDKLRLVEPRK